MCYTVPHRRRTSARCRRRRTGTIPRGGMFPRSQCIVYSCAIAKGRVPRPPVTAPHLGVQCARPTTEPPGLRTGKHSCDIPVEAAVRRDEIHRNLLTRIHGAGTPAIAGPGCRTSGPRAGARTPGSGDHGQRNRVRHPESGSQWPQSAQVMYGPVVGAHQGRPWFHIRSSSLRETWSPLHTITPPIPAHRPSPAAHRHISDI